MAKQAKQFNKFESDGAFLEKYLGKRQENNSEEPIELSEAIDQSNIQSNDINHHLDGHQAEDSDKSSIDEQPSTTLKFKAPAKRISVVQASDVENTAEGIQPHKVIVDKQADSS